MYKSTNELRVAESDMIEPEYFEKCPLCGILIGPDDPKHIDIFVTCMCFVLYVNDMREHILS
jgi:hypothetical protein